MTEAEIEKIKTFYRDSRINIISRPSIKWRGDKLAILSVNEEILLITILSMEEQAYGFSILKRVMETTGKKVVYGTLYNSLDNLAKKGYIKVFKGESTSVRGGKRKVYYEITRLGKEAIMETKKFHELLLSKVSNLVLE
jgi:DNA-binding PadR family transcriptional regulator